MMNTILWRSRDTLERHDTKDEVRYEFPLGFTVMANARGVNFVGTSINYDVGSIQLVERAIDWAKQIHLALKNNEGIPPQGEVEGRLVAKTRGDAAWWSGRYKDRVKDTEGVRAIVLLRRMERKNEQVLADHGLH